MSKIDVNMCDCCKEIYNSCNLIKITISKEKDLNLYLCPDCNKEFKNLYQVKPEKENPDYSDFMFGAKRGNK